MLGGMIGSAWWAPFWASCWPMAWWSRWPACWSKERGRGKEFACIKSTLLASMQGYNQPRR